MNLVVESGYLVKDGEVEIRKGVKVYFNTLAVKSFSKKTDRPFYFNIKAFGDTAEHMKKTSSKGNKVTVTGRLTQSYDEETHIYYNEIEVNFYENNTPPKNSYGRDYDDRDRDYSDRNRRDYDDRDRRDYDDRDKGEDFSNNKSEENGEFYYSKCNLDDFDDFKKSKR